MFARVIVEYSCGKLCLLVIKANSHCSGLKKNSFVTDSDASTTMGCIMHMVKFVCQAQKILVPSSRLCVGREPNIC